MRKLLPFSLIITAILAFSFSANAKPVTAIQAIQRVTGNTTNAPKSMKAVSSSLQLVHTFTASATETEPRVYLFSRGANQGYVITPADDLFPAVLGYSDNGTFDFENMPPAMKAFIEDYAREIDFNLKYAADELATTASLFDPGWEPVGPLMETKWNQDAPYNKMCPMVGSTATYTGCVATSMAQVMKYHEWPDKAEGSHTYTWKNQGTKLTMDFSNIEFDWANMLPEYNQGSYNNTQANAVALLMKAVGYSVDMNYGTNASGAVSRDQGDALVNYFKYSRAIRYQHRDQCSSTEFEKIIYDNLKEGLPVLYNGRSDEGGHSFVCDGYSGKHYFHFNWGWGGHSDGYFYLARLNPDDQGIGSSEGGYNSGQGISYNIRPVRDGIDTGESGTFDIVCTGHFNLLNHTGNSCTFNAKNPKTEQATEGFWNYGSGSFTGQYGVVVRDSENNDTFISGHSTNGLATNYGWKSYSVTLGTFEDGSYTIHPAVRESASQEISLMRVANGCRKYVKMKVTNGSKSFSDMTDEDFVAEAPDMMVNCFNYSGEVYSGKSHNFLLSVTNLSSNTDYYGKLKLVVKDENGDEVATFDPKSYDVPAGNTIPESMSLTFDLEPGLYTVSVKDAFDRELPGEFPVEIMEGEGTTEITSDLRVLSFRPLDVTHGRKADLTFQVVNQGSSSISAPHFQIYYRSVDGFEENSFTGGDFWYDVVFQPNSGFNLPYPSFPFDILSEGEYDVFVIWTNSPNGVEFISPEYRIHVGYPVETVAIDQQGNKLEKDEELKLTATLTPENATYRTLTWSSSNSNIVSVDNDGNIKALSPGTAYIAASAHNGAVDHTEVIVKGNSAIEDIAADELRTVNAIYTISGVKILTNPTEAEIMNLDAGIYIFQTPKRAFTVKK